MLEQIIFYVLMTISIVFSILTVTTRHIIRSATYLLFVLLSTAFIYLLLQYYYLFAVQIVVYAGGIMVLFIFAILLTNKPGEALPEYKMGRKLMTVLISVAGLGLSLFVVYKSFNKMYQFVDMENLKMQELGTTLLGTSKYQYLIPFEAISVLLLASIIGGIMIARKR